MRHAIRGPTHTPQMHYQQEHGSDHMPCVELHLRLQVSCVLDNISARFHVQVRQQSRQSLHRPGNNKVRTNQDSIRDYYVVGALVAACVHLIRLYAEGIRGVLRDKTNSKNDRQCFQSPIVVSKGEEQVQSGINLEKRRKHRIGKLRVSMPHRS